LEGGGFASGFAGFADRAVFWGPQKKKKVAHPGKKKKGHSGVVGFLAKHLAKQAKNRVGERKKKKTTC